MALEQVREGVREALHLLNRLLRRFEGQRVAVGVDRLDVPDQLVERAESPLEHQDVQEQRENDRHREQGELEPLVLDLEVQARSRGGGEERRDHEQQVCGHYLAAERFPAFHRLSEV